MNSLALSADLGGTNLRVAAVDETGEIFHRVRLATPNDGRSGSIIDEIVKAAETCLEAAGSPLGFAIAAPGPLDIKNGKIIRSPNLPELDGQSIVQKIEDRLGIPCLLENDATAATIGENKYGASKGYSNVVGVTLGTGVGGGLIIEGKPYRGLNGMAGEVGHICVEPDGHPCGCGSVGCIEQCASATAIVRMTRELFHDYPDTEIDEEAELTARSVFEAGTKGDRLGLAVFSKVGTCLGITLAGLVNLLTPDVIVIGGGVAAGWDLFAGPMKDTVNKRAFRLPAEHVKIVRAELGDDAGILGAASLIFDQHQQGAGSTT